MNAFSYMPAAPGDTRQSLAFGYTSAGQVSELNKALSIDYSQPPTTFSASPLREYSIDSTLRTVSYTQKNIKAWNRLQRVPAYSTVEEYVKQIDYGNVGVGAFTDPGALPESHDSSFERDNKNVKYLGTLRAVQHPATLVKTTPVQNLIAAETVNGTVFLLGVIESHLFTGDSGVVSQEWDGLFTEIQNWYAAQPTSNIVVDMRGASIAKSDLTDGANVVLNNYGIPSGFYSDLLVMADLNSLYYGNQRYNDQRGGAGITGGTAQNDFTFASGQTFDYIPDVFLRPNTAPPSVAAPKAAGVPTATPTTAVNAATLFSGAITVNYKVTSVNQYGESLPCAPVTVSIAGGEACTLALSIGAPTSYAATGYRIYRQDPSGSYTLIKTIPVASAPFVDLNFDMPSTSKAVLLMEDPVNYVFKQLAPFTKLPLGNIDASIRWLQLLYGVPILATPQKNVMYKNIGRRAGALIKY